MRKLQGKEITIFAAGCFNRIHKAHLAMLRCARVLGDRLVLVLANDAHNRKPNALPAAQRLARLRAMKVADKIAIGDAGSFAASLLRERPDILVLGYDQRLPDAETEKTVKDLGIEVVVMPWMPGKEAEDRADASCRA